MHIRAQPGKMNVFEILPHVLKYARCFLKYALGRGEARGEKRKKDRQRFFAGGSAIHIYPSAARQI